MKKMIWKVTWWCYVIMVRNDREQLSQPKSFHCSPLITESKTFCQVNKSNKWSFDQVIRLFLDVTSSSSWRGWINTHFSWISLKTKNMSTESWSALKLHLLSGKWTILVTIDNAGKFIRLAVTYSFVRATVYSCKNSKIYLTLYIKLLYLCLLVCKFFFIWLSWFRFYIELCSQNNCFLPLCLLDFSTMVSIWYKVTFWWKTFPWIDIVVDLVLKIAWFCWYYSLQWGPQPFGEKPKPTTFRWRGRWCLEEQLRKVELFNINLDKDWILKLKWYLPNLSGKYIIIFWRGLQVHRY